MRICIKFLRKTEEKVNKEALRALSVLSGFLSFVPLGFFREVIAIAKERRYYRIIGGFFFLRIEIFEKVCGFDEATFLYAEEQILTENMKPHGFVVYYLRIKLVVHDQGQTTSANYGIK